MEIVKLGYEAVKIKKLEVILPCKDLNFWNWFAGFWEGEGSLSFLQEYMKKNGKFYKRTRMTVSQMKREPLDYILNNLKVGYMYFRKPTKERKTKIKFNDNGTWIWSLDRRREIIAVCKEILPFLRFRNKEVIEKLKLIEQVELDSKWRHWYTDEENFLKENYNKISMKELCLVLNRSYKSIEQKWRKIKNVKENSSRI